MAAALELCEADNQVLRIREELQLLPREMRAHLRHYQTLIQRQEELIQTLQQVQPGTDDAAAQQLAAILQVGPFWMFVRAAVLRVILWKYVACRLLRHLDISVVWCHAANNCRGVTH